MDGHQSQHPPQQTRSRSGGRLISSTVVSNTELNEPIPTETVRYVEVPVVKEQVVHVPKKEIYEVEKVVPVYDYQYREKIVEVPQLETINTEVEVEQVQEVVKRVPVKQIVEVAKEVIRYVPKVVTKIVEREVEVAGDVIQVPKPYKVENKVIVPRYINEEIPMVVTQLVEPVISESTTEAMEVVLKDYEPYLVPVEVYVPRPVERPLIPIGQSHRHQVIDVPPSQFNALVKTANAGATDRDVDGLLVKQLDGSIPMLNTPDLKLIRPNTEEWRAGHVAGQLRIAAPPGQTFVHPSLDRGSVRSA